MWRLHRCDLNRVTVSQWQFSGVESRPGDQVRVLELDWKTVLEDEGVEDHDTSTDREDAADGGSRADVDQSGR